MMWPMIAILSAVAKLFECVICYGPTFLIGLSAFESAIVSQAGQK
jgi:hypothetical protein